MKTEVDDWLTELPPLDGGDDEPDAGDEVTDDPLPEPEDASSLDDALAEDLDVDIGVDIADGEPGTDPAKSNPSNVSKDLQTVEADDERWEADVGEAELDLVDDEPAVGDDGEPPAAADGDFGDHEDLPASDDDSGEEGTTDPIEHSLDEELPAMDADDEGDFEDALLLETGEVAHDLESLRWADAAWSECSSLHRSFSWVAIENDPLVALASSAGSEVIAAMAQSGAVWVSRDGGQTARRAGGAYAQLLSDSGDERPPFMALGLDPGGNAVLWIGTSSGQLAKSRDFGESFKPFKVGRPIMALAMREDGSLVALARGEGAMTLLTSADGATWFSQRLSGEVAALGSPSVARARWMACRGIAVALGDDRGALLSRDGRHFTRVLGTAGATAGVFAGTDARAPLVLSGAFGEDDEIHLARAPQDGLAEIVAEVAAATTSGSGGGSIVLGLRWLEEPGAVGVFFSRGAVAWGPTK